MSAVTLERREEVRPVCPHCGCTGRIYELKGDTLRICFNEQSNIDVAEGKVVERPKSFDAPVGRENVLI